MTAQCESVDSVSTMVEAAHTRLGRCRTCIVITACGLVLSWTAFILARRLIPDAPVVAAGVVPVAIAFTLLASMHAGAIVARRRESGAEVGRPARRCRACGSSSSSGAPGRRSRS